MDISKIALENFRNFKKKIFEFSPKLTIIVGPNAIGKTNILESLFLLSTGKSFRAKIEEEIINYDQNISRVKGVLGETKLEVILTKDVDGWPRKKLLVNGVSRRLIDFAGNFKVVLFGPWDMDLVTESPSLRRKFLDTVISQVDREYRRMLLSYDKGLRQRNRLLEKIRDEGLSRNQLTFWNQLLIKCGDYISQRRGEFIDYVNSTKSPSDTFYDLEYDRSVISEGRLEEYASEEVYAATTLVGPHRDDFIFKIKKGKLKVRNLSSFGSRGEERMGVLWLKLAELTFIEDKTGVKPTLLLDDIFSELDQTHRDVVLKVIGNQQTILTTADGHIVKGFKKNNRIDL